MQPSPIQLKNMSYLGIKVWPRYGAEEASTDPFDFNGVIIGEGVEVAVLPEGAKDTIYAVRLHIKIANEEGAPAPYDLDIEVAGIFEISDKVTPDERENMITINGCAVLYSAIRDQVLTLTSRSSLGPLMLPTVNFLDHKKFEHASPAAPPLE
ncbi:MAG: hypothetical protein CRU78_03325 [Candidatus Accumulibacter phosphatis]|mgnify:CR=1 FL=1|uniref:Preprotein translocase subunit SecB n=1 Tax=Candidatus Accumulibacter phosphatis TaxID=327160 RepID=A0A6A7RPY5_9PROT|nr:hypothetical protein [Candidatus Accumulibacter phosphatis]